MKRILSSVIICTLLCLNVGCGKVDETLPKNSESNESYIQRIDLKTEEKNLLKGFGIESNYLIYELNINNSEINAIEIFSESYKKDQKQPENQSFRFLLSSTKEPKKAKIFLTFTDKDKSEEHLKVSCIEGESMVASSKFVFNGLGDDKSRGRMFGDTDKRNVGIDAPGILYLETFGNASGTFSEKGLLEVIKDNALTNVLKLKLLKDLNGN